MKRRLKRGLHAHWTRIEPIWQAITPRVSRPIKVIPGSVLVLGELSDVSWQVPQLQVGQAVVAEVLQQATPGRAPIGRRERGRGAGRGGQTRPHLVVRGVAQVARGTPAPATAEERVGRVEQVHSVAPASVLRLCARRCSNKTKAVLIYHFRHKLRENLPKTSLNLPNVRLIYHQ